MPLIFMNNQITPKSLVLSILQASNNCAMQINILVSIGKIFGFTGNTIRVTTTRLIREGTIESDERGLYHLSNKGSEVSRIIEWWRDSEARMKRWNGEWLCFLTANKKVKRKQEDEFGLFGFKEGLPNLWVRPDNLTIENKEVSFHLSQIGKMKEAEMFVAHQFESKRVERWQIDLWPIESIIKRLKDFVPKIEKSADRIQKMPLENALVESFLIGSEAIRLLITDPLLPEEIMDTSPRIILTEAMKTYDKLGREIWSKRFEEARINRTPAHLYLTQIAI